MLCNLPFSWSKLVAVGNLPQSHNSKGNPNNSCQGRSRSWTCRFTADVSFSANIGRNWSTEHISSISLNKNKKTPTQKLFLYDCDLTCVAQHLTQCGSCPCLLRWDNSHATPHFFLFEWPVLSFHSYLILKVCAVNIWLKSNMRSLFLKH